MVLDLDTFHDHRRAFFFGVNPLGVQTDGVRSEGSGAGTLVFVGLLAALALVAALAVRDVRKRRTRQVGATPG